MNDTWEVMFCLSVDLLHTKWELHWCEDNNIEVTKFKYYANTMPNLVRWSGPQDKGEIWMADDRQIDTSVLELSKTDLLLPLELYRMYI